MHKHVEPIFQKLGLETRNAATLAALDLFRPPGAALDTCPPPRRREISRAHDH